MELATSEQVAVAPLARMMNQSPGVYLLNGCNIEVYATSIHLLRQGHNFHRVKIGIISRDGDAGKRGGLTIWVEDCNALLPDAMPILPAMFEEPGLSALRDALAPVFAKPEKWLEAHFSVQLEILQKAIARIAKTIPQPGYMIWQGWIAAFAIASVQERRREQQERRREKQERRREQQERRREKQERRRKTAKRAEG